MGFFAEGIDEYVIICMRESRLEVCPLVLLIV